MKRIKVLKAYFIIWFFIFYVAWVNVDLLSIFFMATVIFSSAILGLLIVGALYQIACGFGIVMLGGTFGALAYKKTGYEFYLKAIDSILPANIAHMLTVRKSQQKMLFTQEESRNIIEWLNEKFSKQKSYTNFFINTSMLVGLLGTFVGLVEAIDRMGQIILSLNGEIDIKQIMQDFSGPLSGMAIGFGASLFGVMCAVILGINGYVLFRSQDTLISGIEDWLKDRIIDVMPETNQSVGSSSSLPEQRKNFMDVFLEQMHHLTKEIALLSHSHEKFETINNTLVSMNSVMHTNQSNFQHIVSNQEKQTAYLEQGNLNMQQSHVLLQRHHHESQDTFSKLFDEQNTVLGEHSHNLKTTFEQSVRDVHTKLEAQHETALSSLGIQEEIKAQAKQLHQSSQSTLEEMHRTMAQDAQNLTTLLQSHVNNWNQLSHTFIEMQEHLKTIRQESLQHTTVLNHLATLQSDGFRQTQQSYEIFQKQINGLDTHVLETITLLTNMHHYHQGQDEITSEYNNHVRILLDSMQMTQALTKETLVSLLNTSEAFKVESSMASTKASQHLVDVENVLFTQQNRLESLIAVQESFSTRYTTSQQAIQEILTSLDERMRNENQINSNVLSVSKNIHQTQQAHMTTAQEMIGHMQGELSKIEQAQQENLAQQHHFENAYLENSEYKHSMMIKTLNDKLVSTQNKLESMDGSLKMIEEKLSLLNEYSLVPHSHKAEDIKNFFSTLFTKKS